MRQGEVAAARACVENAIAALTLTLLGVNLDHAERQTTLPSHHRDPLDRLLSVQALTERLALVRVDAIFDAYGVTRLWT